MHFKFILGLQSTGNNYFPVKNRQRTTCELVGRGRQLHSYRRVKRDPLIVDIADNGRVNFILKLDCPNLCSSFRAHLSFSLLD